MQQRYGVRVAAATRRFLFQATVESLPVHFHRKCRRTPKAPAQMAVFTDREAHHKAEIIYFDFGHFRKYATSIDGAMP
jgi:hypothetical protein